MAILEFVSRVFLFLVKNKYKTEEKKYLNIFNRTSYLYQCTPLS